MDNTTIGIDVSKGKLDICILPDEKYLQVNNDKKGIHQLKNLLLKRKSDIKVIIIEHTGAYQRLAVNILVAAGLPVSVVNPAKPRAFAKALGRLGKTDKIDAYILAEFGRKFETRIVSYSPNINKLKDLAAQKRDLSAMITADKNRLEKSPLETSEKIIEQRLKFLEKQLKQVMLMIKDLINQTPEFKEKFDKLSKVKGVGIVTIMTLICEMPELGSLNKREVAALAGVAQMNRDSGTMHGYAFIQGGRKAVRNALYMAAVSSVRYNDVIHEFYTRLRNKGKPAKLALTASMRKILIYLNSLLAN